MNKFAAITCMTALAVACSVEGKETDYRDDLKEAISSYETARTDASETIVEATENIQTAVEGANIASKITKTTKPHEAALEMWVVEWESAMSKVEALEGRFDKVVSVGEDFFGSLRGMEKKYSTPEAAAMTRRENDKMQAKWDGSVRQARQNIQALYAFLEKGNDKYLDLKSAAYRASISKEIVVLTDIAHEAEMLLEQLKQLTEEGNRLTIGIG